MSEITQQTLVDLQLPTMSLVEKFCETPEEVKSFFAGMTAVYENAPTADNIRRIADKIKSRDSREQKQDWLRQELKQVSATARENAVEKYIKQKNAVPAGLPCSGDLLTYLDYVPRQAKDELLEAQAAARILSHLSEGRKDLKGTVIGIGPDGMPKEAKEFLNKPFATSIQRTEQIADFLCAYQNNEKQINLSQMHDDRLEALCRGDMPQDSMPEVAKALAECRKYAVQTLKKSAENITRRPPAALTHWQQIIPKRTMRRLILPSLPERLKRRQAKALLITARSFPVPTGRPNREPTVLMQPKLPYLRKSSARETGRFKMHRFI